MIAPAAPGGDGEATDVEAAHRHLEAVALLADAVGGRDLDVLEDQRPGVARAQAELVVVAGGAEASAALPLQQERADAVVGLLAVGVGEDQEAVGVVAEADPGLLAVQDVDVALAAGGAAHRRHVAAGVGLGQPEGAHLRPLGQGSQQALLLLLAAPLVDARAAEPVVHRGRRADRGVDVLQLLHHQAQRQVVHARPAVPLGHRDARQPQPGQLGEGVGVVALEPVVLLDDLGELGAHEAASGLDQQLLLGGKRQVKHAAAIQTQAEPPARPAAGAARWS